MKWSIAALLITALAAADCARPVAVNAPAGPSPAVALPAVRATVHSTADVLSDTPEMVAWAEARTRPSVSGLLPDPQDGVWAGQDGELFHFQVRADHTFGRVTYGRPQPAAVWVGDLLRLSDRRLAGRVFTRHLMRKAADGKVAEVAAARSPGGAPFDFLDVRQGELHLHDAYGEWYRLSERDKALRPVPEFTSGSQSGNANLAASVQEAFQHETGGTIRWAVQMADNISYALVDREQLFTFDVDSRQFKLLGQPGLEPVGSLNGQIVARFAGGLVTLDDQGHKVREFPADLKGASVLPGADGWFYSLPFLAINLITGEERRYEVPDGIRGGVTALLPLADGRMVGGTAHGGSLFLFDSKKGQVTMWGRPIPELGQLSGEELAPIQGLIRGADGYVYAAIGTGASGRPESHLVRLGDTGRVVAKTHLPEAVHGLVLGVDGRIYGAGFDRVVVLPRPDEVR